MERRPTEDKEKKIFWVDDFNLERCSPTGYEVKMPGGWVKEYVDSKGKIHYGGKHD